MRFPLLFLAALCTAAVLPAQSQEDELVWLDNYKDAVKLAKSTGKPIFLEYRCEP